MKINGKSNIAIISHFTIKEEGESEVFPGNIRNFLLKKKGKIVYIDHPFISSQGASSDFISSQMRIYENGQEVERLTAPGIKVPTIILFIYQMLLTTIFMLIRRSKYDFCIACDNLSLISVILLRKFGLIKKLIYYTVDYSPKRYTNPFLNKLYHYMDRLASQISDINWVAVKNMIKAKEDNGLDIKKSAPFQIVPIGLNTKNIEIKSIKEIDRFNLIFVGYIFEKQGLQLIVEALPQIIEKYPKVHLTVIGSGPYEEEINKQILNKGLRSHVKFTGYIKDHQEIIKYLIRGGVGLATYVPSIGDYTYNADPSKVKLYLACGLPVLTTAVPPIAKEIVKKKAGFITAYNEKDLIGYLEKIFADKLYFAYRRNALRMAEDFDTEIILDKAFRRLS